MMFRVRKRGDKAGTYNSRTMITNSGCRFLLPKCHLSTNLSVYTRPSQCSVDDAGLIFNEKIRYLSNYLQINTQKALTQHPILRTTPLSTFQTTFRTLSSMGLKKAEISRILDMHPVLLTSDPHLYVYPVIEFLLNEVSIPFSDISTCISRCPRLLVSSVHHRLRPNLEYLKSLGFTGADSINSQTTVLLVYDKDATLASKVNFFLSLGLQFDEVKKMVVRSPAILTYSIEKNLKPKVKYLFEEIGGDLSDLKVFPQYFSFSLEGRIKWRHKMLMQYNIKLSLQDMLKVSDGEFSARLVERRLQRGSHRCRTAAQKQLMGS